MYCPNCGNFIIDSIGACQKCGFVLNNTNPSSNVSPVEAISSSSEMEPTSAVDIPLSQQMGSTSVSPIAFEPTMGQNNSNSQNPSMIQTSVEPLSINPQQGLNPTSDGNKKKINIVKIMLPIIVIGVLIVIGLFVYNKILKDNKTIDITSSTSFFLENNSGLYALFDDDGNQLTDFLYSSVGSIINNSVRVVKDDEYGVISSNGKTLIEFGEYKYIYAKTSLYEVVDTNYNYYLVDKNGNIIYTLASNDDVLTYSSVDTFVVIESSSKYILLNYEGEKILEVFITSNDDDPIVGYTDPYGTFAYNDITYIFNAITCEIIVTVEGGEYVISEIDDKKMILYDSDSEIFKLIEGNRVIDLDEYTYAYFDDASNVVVIKSGISYLLDDNYNEVIQIDDASYVDTKNYAIDTLKITDDNFSVNFYSNGTLVKSVGCRELSSTGYNKFGVYVLKTYYSSECNTTSGIYELYNSKGELITSKTFKDVSLHYYNTYIRVSEDDTNYYLLDTSGNQVGEVYKSIYNIEEEGSYYKVYDGSKYGILDSNGDLYLNLNYTKIEAKRITYGIYALLTDSNGKIIVYDLDGKKEVLTTSGKVTLTDHYIKVVENNETKYYSYTKGELFYEE